MAFRSNEMEMKCPYFRNGCDVIFEAGQEGALHTKKCQYKQEICWQCDSQVLRKSLASHLTSICYGRIVVCNTCDEEMPFKQLEDHDNKCPKKLVICPYCHGQVLQKDKEIHFKDCQNITQFCGFKDIGCKFEGTKGELIEHNQKEQTQHNELIAQHFTHIHGTLAGISSDFPGVKKTAEDLVSKCEALETVISKLSYTVAVKETEIKHLKYLVEENKRLIQEEQTIRQSLVLEQQEQNKEFENKMESLEATLNSVLQQSRMGSLDLKPGGEMWLDGCNLMVAEVSQQIANMINVDIADILLIYLEYDLFILGCSKPFVVDMLGQNFEMVVSHITIRNSVRLSIDILTTEEDNAPAPALNHVLLGLIDADTNCLLYYQIRCAERTESGIVPEDRRNDLRMTFKSFRLSTHKLDKALALTTNRNLELILMFYQR